MLTPSPSVRPAPFLASLLLVALFTGPGHAGTPPASVLYVNATTGVDLPGGGTLTAPLRTISFALTESLGLTSPVEVRVAAGVYDAALGETFPQLVPARVRVVGAGTGKTLVTTGSASGAFEFDSNLTGGLPYTDDSGLARLTLIGDGIGVEVDAPTFAPAARPDLRELQLIGFETGIVAFGSKSSAEPSLANLTFLACGTGLELGNLDSAHTWNLSDSRFIGCNIGLDARSGGVPFSNTDTFVDRCRFEGCALGVKASGSRTTTVHLQDCAIVAGGDACLASGFFPGTGNVELIRSTVAGNARGLVGISVGTYRFFLDHTIVWGNAVGYADFGVVPELKMSAVWSNLQPTWPGAIDPSNFQLEPFFLDPHSRDYRLSSFSPLVDAGIPTAPQSGVDLRMQPRLLDGNGDLIARLDLGAYEFDLVDLTVSGTALLGGVLALEVTSPAGWVELAVYGLAPADIPLGSLGSLLIQPAGLTSVPQGLLPLPSNPGLAGLEVYLQAAGVNPATSAGATSRRVQIELQ